MSNYSFPLDLDWTTQEVIIVVEFLSLVEKAYGEGVLLGEFMDSYRLFKGVVDSISGEKRIGRKFSEVSGYDLYPVVKCARQLSKDKQARNTIIKL